MWIINGSVFLTMLQIIIFQLSFGIWLVAGLHEKDAIKGIGLVAALVFSVWGVIQGAQVSSLVP